MSAFYDLLLEEYRDPLETFIAIRPRGVRGSGTINDPFNGASIPNPAISISQLTYSGTVATAITATPHGFQDGAMVTISGVDIQFTTRADRNYIGTFPITVLSGTSFSYQMLTNGYPTPAHPTANPAAGGIQCWLEREQFDVIMREALPGSLIHIGVGVFDTKGHSPFYAGGSVISGGWIPQPRMRIVGSGRGLTTLRMTGIGGGPGASIQAWVVGFGKDQRADSFQLEDLTIDCNVAYQPNSYASCSAFCVIGEGLGAHHVRIRRVQAINFGSVGPIGTPGPPESAYLENFPFFLGGPDLVDNRYEDCVMERPSPDANWNSTIMHMSGGLIDGVKWAYSRGNTLRNNYINGQIGYGQKAWIKEIDFPSGHDAGQVTLTTKTPHGITFPGNVSVQGLTVGVYSGPTRVGSSTNNRFNGVFKVDEIVSETILKYTVFSTDNPMDPDALSLREVGGDPDPAGPFAILGAPVSPHLLGVTPTYTASDWRTFHIQTRNYPLRPHNLTVNNRVLVTGITLDDVPQYDVNLLNRCNGSAKVTNVTSKTKLEFQAENESFPASSYDIGGDPVIGNGHAFMSADNGTGAVVEGNRLMHGATGGPWNDTGSTLDLVARNNYYHDMAAGPNQNGGDTVSVPLRSVAALTHLGKVATCTTDSLGHNVLVGQVVQVGNVRINASPKNPYNGFHIVKTLVSPTVFTFEMTSDPGADPDPDPIPQFQPVAQTMNRTLEKNIIELTPGPAQGFWNQPTAIYMAVVPDLIDSIPYTFRRALVRGNLIRQADWTTDQFHTAITVRGSEKLLVHDNVADVGYAHPLSFKQSVSPSFLNNRTPAGKLIRGYDEVAAKGASEIETMLDDVFLMTL